MRIVHHFENPERCVVGTVGQPGERTFFLQAKDGARVIAVAIEKSQAAALAERIIALLPDETLPSRFDDKPLETPVVEEFRAGVMALAWDPSTSLITIEAQALDEEVEEVIEGQEGPDLFRVLINPSRAMEFAARARSVVAAGRQPCPFCSLPLDPQGHICPRANGYRR